MDYRKRIIDINKEMLDELRSLIEQSQGTINIPFYYEEWELDDDVETLIEDEYDIREGDSSDNVVITLDTYGEQDHEVVAVSVGTYYNPNEVTIIDKRQNTYGINEHENPFMIEFLLDKVKEKLAE